MRRALIALLSLSLAAPTLTSQIPSTDPRFGEDPREQPDDPRKLHDDPRRDEVEQRALLRTDQLRGAEQFELLDSEGKKAELASAIGAQPWELLGWIDSMCESWLALRERASWDTAETQLEANSLRAKLERSALLADQTIGDTAFSAWVARVLAWDDEQIARYRHAQVLFKQGLTAFNEATSAQHALRALTPLRQAQEQLQPLGTTWEAITTLSLIGRIQMANGQQDGARETLQEALRMGRSLRDRDAVWNGIAVLLDDAIRQADYNGAEKLLAEQYRISMETGDQASADDVIRRLTDLTRYRQLTHQ
ncbi:MAG: hypothetical protein DRQ55_11405 [Planctomycetota bacterium]|nr:MAG: hypothetical protein DRQ55_11405 [Planctomycetota bacterium]